MAILPVMSLPVDVAAGLIQFVLNPGAFAQCEDAARTPGAGFGQADARLFGFEPGGFAARQFAAAQASANAALLIVFAVVNASVPALCEAGQGEQQGQECDKGQFFQPTFLHTTSIVLPYAARRGKRLRYGGARR